MKSDFSHPTALPQHDEGQSQGTTYATLSDGILTIGGRNTTAQEIGIHSDAATAHRQAEALPDLEAVLQRQQIVSKATADIGSGVQAYISRQIRENVAASNQADKDLEIAAANNDEAGVQDALQRRAQAEQNITQWKPGGSKARALGAVTTLITGYLGGQSAQQAAANATAPYAAKVIGDSFSQHGSHPNQAVQLLSHAVLGGFLAQVNGGSFKEGATAAAGAEAVATAITRGLYGEEAARYPDLLNEDEKTLVRNLSAAVGAVASGLSGDSLAAVQRGGVIGRNAVENNELGNPLYPNSVDATVKAAILRGDVEMLEIALAESASLTANEAAIARNALAAMRNISANDARYLAERYGWDWANKVNHIFKSHSGGIGNSLLQRAGSAEKAVLSAQRAIDRMGITGSGQRYVIIKI